MLARVTLALGLCAAGTVAAVSFWLTRTLPDYGGHFALAGVSAQVRIVRDAHAVPHILAATEDDAFFALGFAHAQDRLWQMEWQRRLARGELAAMVGAEALPADRLARLMNIGARADEGMRFLSADVRRALDAYAAGVNAWIENAPALPPEFALLRVRPQPWRAADSVALLRGMAAQMAYNVKEELLGARLARRLSAAEFHDFYPDLATATEYSRLPRFEPLTPDAAASVASFARPGASNVWAVSRNTATGAPILASDPHTALGSPGLWYLTRIDTPGLRVAGATVPGFPFVLLGHNADLAWGMTSSGADVQDIFLERLDPSDSSRYLTPGGSAPFEIRRETIAVAGRDPETLALRSTRHGPVLSDVGPRAAQLADAGTVLSLAYAGDIDDDGTAEAVYRINHAGNWDDFAAAASLWTAPVQNLVMADRLGASGIVLAGRIPSRRGGDGRLPRLGWTGQDDWDGTVPFADLPKTKNPASGRIVEANDTVPMSRGVRLGEPPDAHLRAERINALLDRSVQHTLDEFQRIQADAYAADAERLLPLLLRSQPVDAGLQRVHAMLQRWNRVMDPQRPEPLIYAAWLRELTRLLFAARLGDIFDDAWDTRPDTLTLALAAGSRWCGSSGNCDRIIAESLRMAFDGLAGRYGNDVANWRWGAAHRADLTHPVWSRVPFVAGAVALAPAIGGGDFTVGRARMDFSKRQDPFVARYGAAFRGIYDLADLSRSRFVISTGQSGNPLSRYSADFADLWARGEMVTLASHASGIAPDGIGTTILSPPQ